MGSPNKTALLPQSARHMCVQRRAIPMLLRLKDLSLRAKIKFLRELPAHYQTPVSATPSASVHEEVATYIISKTLLQWRVRKCVYHKIVKLNSLNSIPDFYPSFFATSYVDPLPDHFSKIDSLSPHVFPMLSRSQVQISMICSQALNACLRITARMPSIQHRKLIKQTSEEDMQTPLG